MEDYYFLNLLKVGRVRTQSHRDGQHNQAETIGRDVCQKFIFSPDLKFLDITGLHWNKTFINLFSHQHSPGAPSQCGHLITTASDCMVRESRKEALELCSSLLMLPKFVRCFTNKTLEHETDSVLELFGACLNALCHRITPECLLVQDRITSSHCVDDTVPELTGFNCQF